MSREVVNKTGGVEVNGRLYFGMDAELALKAQQNYDYGLEKEIAEWIEGVLGKKLPNRDFAESLKSGVILCELLNVIRPNTIKKINTRSIALMEIENIKLYLEGCWKLGVPSGDLFVSSDLYNKKSMQAVLQNLTSLSRLAARIPSYSGPLMASHSRSSSSSSSSTAPSKPPPKKWDTINIGQPKFVTDNQPVESIDLRSEIVKLQQELDRERFDRSHLERKLEALSSSASPSPSINNNNNNNNIVVKSSEEDKREINRLNEKITRMEKDIEGLNNQLQVALSGKDSLVKSEKENVSLRSSLSSLERDVAKLKDDLNCEKLAHDKSKRDLSDQKSSAVRLEATVQDLKSQISSLSKSSSPSPSPANNANNNVQQAEITRLNQKITSIENQYFDERTVHNQLKNEYNRLVSDLSLVQSENKKLMRQIQDLDDANSLLKKSSSSSSSSNSQSEQRLQQKIRSLEDQLFDEQTVHNHLKNDHSSLQKELQSLRDTIANQQRQITDMQQQISSSSSSSPANKENKVGGQVANKNNTLQRKNTENSRLLARNYFILDYEEDGNEFEANKELSKRVWDCLHNLLHSKYVDFADVVELNRFFKIDAGRRKFTQMLELTMQEAPTLTLTDSAFELLLYLVNTTLTEMDLSDSADLITAKILMKASSILKRTVNNKEEYIMDFIKSYQVWKQQTFWEELFWDELFKKHKQRSLSNSESEDEDLYTMDHDLTVFILELIANTMIHWNVHKDQIYQFVVNMCMQTKLPESETSKMLAKMNNDNYWIIDPATKHKPKKQKKQSKKQKKQSKK